MTENPYLEGLEEVWRWEDGWTVLRPLTGPQEVAAQEYFTDCGVALTALGWESSGHVVRLFMVQADGHPGAVVDLTSFSSHPGRLVSLRYGPLLRNWAAITHFASFAGQLGSDFPWFEVNVQVLVREVAVSPHFTCSCRVRCRDPVHVAAATLRARPREQADPYDHLAAFFSESRARLAGRCPDAQYEVDLLLGNDPSVFAMRGYPS